MEQAFSAQLLTQEQRFNTFIQNSGYDVIGEYTDGPLTIDEYNQLIRYNNELWKLTAATELPFTTTGNDASSWATDSTHFVSVGDAALRQELASPGGAALVGAGVMSRGNDRFSIMQGRASEYQSEGMTYGIGVILNDPIAGIVPNSNTARFNYILIEDEQINAVDDTTSGTKVDGLLVNHKFGGSSAKGGRHAGEFISTHKTPTSASNTDRNYVGVVGLAVSQTGDGGSSSAAPGTFKGAYFGGNMYGRLDALAVGVYNVTGCEFNTAAAAGSSVWYRSGIQIVGGGDVQGSAVDAGIAISNFSAATVRWRNAIRIGNMNGGHALAADSKILVAFTDVTTIASGFEIPKCSGSVLLSGDVNLENNKLTMAAPGSSIEIGSTATAGTSYIDFHSSGNAIDNDGRIFCSGGSSTTGGGTVGFNAAIIQLNANTEIVMGSTIRPGSDNTYDYGTASRRGRTAYFGTGAINTSDSRHKPVQEQIPDKVLDAWSEVDWGTWFKFDDAIALKGEDGARWHFGLIAQRVEEVFAAHGIDGFQLGLLCHDEWDDVYVDVQTNIGEVIKKTRKTEDGIEEYTEPAPAEFKVVLDTPAGERYGIRYEEALSLEAALQRRNYARLLAVQEVMAARIEKLESLLRKAN
ncbi:TPA: tail fiber domain-containing protein [Escherichia coli]|nr:tail fiber domain-containing protein [Escherichia coli]HCO6672302.1 tail fiber domain-containing protein [Escherichia coli]HCO6809919.1 tail fiber domain-containing protein [Escherichia coli]HCO9451373.1 tail fiber domain-containing protein [Escherichia coli]HCO9965388.1 tail fiber domain-containing protein [Escherichia coli]